MHFSEKLDFLMNITKTTNSALSLQIKLDASHISRMRRGQRNAPKEEACLKAMAAYFAKRCGEAYQRKALTDALRIKASLSDENEIATLIWQWLTNQTRNEVKTVENVPLRIFRRQQQANKAAARPFCR